MDSNRLTQQSQDTLRDAEVVALRRNHPQVDGEHLLLALLDPPGGLVPRLLTELGVDVDRLRGEVEEDLSLLPRVSGDNAAPAHASLTPRLRRLLKDAQREAAGCAGEIVSVEHLLLALTEESPAMPAGRRLREHRVTREACLSALLRVRDGARERQPTRTANPLRVRRR